MQALDRHSSASDGVQAGQSSHSYHRELKLRRGAWRNLSRLQWLASNPRHKRATGRAVATGCCPLLQDLLPTFKSAYHLGKQEREHIAVIDMNNNQKQQSELLMYLARQAYRGISKRCCSNCLCGALLYAVCSLGALTGAARSRLFPQAAVNAPTSCSCCAFCSGSVDTVRQQMLIRQTHVDVEVQGFAIGIVGTSQAP